MGGIVACACFPYLKGNRRPRAEWVVTLRECNYRRGYNPSTYSEVRCTKCGRIWRTKAKYVDRLPDIIGD